MSSNSYIKVVVQSVSNDLNDYIEYISRFALDYSMEVNLVTNSPLVNNPVFINDFGDNASYSVKELENDLIESNKQGLLVHAKKLNDDGVTVTASIELGTLASNAEEETSEEVPLMWTLMQSSEDSFLNILMGTEETQIVKGSSEPVLLLPDNAQYKKPTNLLMIVDNMTNINFSGVRKLIESMNINVTYVFNEEIPEFRIHEFLQTMNRSFAKPDDELFRVSMIDLEERLPDIILQTKSDWLGIMNLEKTMVERLYSVNANKIMLSTDFPIFIA